MSHDNKHKVNNKKIVIVLHPPQGCNFIFYCNKVAIHHLTPIFIFFYLLPKKHYVVQLLYKQHDNNLHEWYDIFEAYTLLNQRYFIISKYCHNNSNNFSLDSEKFPYGVWPLYLTPIFLLFWILFKILINIYSISICTMFTFYIF